MKPCDILMNDEPENLGGGVADGAGNEGASHATPAFDPNAFAESFGKSFAETNARLAPKQQPEMSVEDFRKQTNYYSVGKQDVEELFGQPPEGVDADKWYAQKAAALQRIGDGVAGHANKVAGLLTQFTSNDVKRGILEQFEPVLKDVNERKFNSYLDEVVSGDELLKEFDGAKDLVKTAVGMMQAQGYKSQGAQADTKNIREAVKLIIQKAGGNVAAANGANRGNRGNTPQQLNGGGGSGAPAKAGKGDKKEPWQKLGF